MNRNYAVGCSARKALLPSAVRYEAGAPRS
jgi:hypothetical protein